jgi:CheY-like chemotaxis protein
MEDIKRGIRQAQKDLESHRRRAAEVRADLKNLVDRAIAEIFETKELRGRVMSLQARSAGPARQLRPAPGDDVEPSIRELDWEVEKLQVIQRLLEEPPPRSVSDGQPRFPPSTPSPGKKRILVVDDDPITVNIVTRFLHKENFEVLSSPSGIDGLRTALQQNPDLILLDILMPDLTGFQFLYALRRARKDSLTPVIILSTLSGETDVLQGLAYGAADYVTKPFSPQVLMAKVKKNIDSRP